MKSKGLAEVLSEPLRFHASASPLPLLREPETLASLDRTRRLIPKDGFWMGVVFTSSTLGRAERTHKMPPSASQVVSSRMQITLHATRRRPHGTLRLVLEMSA